MWNPSGWDKNSLRVGGVARGVIGVAIVASSSISLVAKVD
eukprot:CAMPEP_0201889248 /NCGR_PEP_ID=MMETSP0902-20130614/29532_1 /ASSEMBLY_ACC=CAM_ASM_000551 /TAXON_ID=420261 /ORGANISM="Thalassiosira antarctica, Strain CCMP982" /LENGTH=39 /DNA_ID= /DNA_START= /DNA_END= /DNA_ORIENTATION=